MDIRKKLVELLKENCHFGQKCSGECTGCMADHLIANGVTIKGVETDTVETVTDCHGCEYCDDPHPARDCALPDGTEQMLVCYPDGTIWGKPFIYRREINFCPMCGRKLTTPPKGE